MSSELQLGETRIEAAGTGQSRVRPLLDNASMMHDEDAVAREHGREPMGDHDRSAPLHQFRERRGNQRLAFGIKRRGRLVEQEERRVAQDGAGDGDPLALSARKRDTALADRRVEATRQRRNE